MLSRISGQWILDDGLSFGILQQNGRVRQLDYTQFSEGDFVDITLSLNILRRQDGELGILLQPHRIVKIKAAKLIVRFSFVLTAGSRPCRKKRSLVISQCSLATCQRWTSTTAPTSCQLSTESELRIDFVYRPTVQYGTYLLHASCGWCFRMQCRTVPCRLTLLGFHMLNQMVKPCLQKSRMQSNLRRWRMRVMCSRGGPEDRVALPNAHHTVIVEVKTNFKCKVGKRIPR